MGAYHSSKKKNGLGLPVGDLCLMTVVVSDFSLSLTYKIVVCAQAYPSNCLELVLNFNSWRQKSGTGNNNLGKW